MDCISGNFMGKCYFERSQIPKLHVKHLQGEHLEFYTHGSLCMLLDINLILSRDPHKTGPSPMRFTD